MNKQVLIWSAVLGSSAVIFGAMGAHTLKPLLTTEQLHSFETGVKYQMYHAIVLLIFGLFSNNKADFFKWSIKLFILGTLLFSGSIYLLTLKNLFDLEWLKYAGPITPLGGVLLIAGWILILIKAISIKKDGS